MSQPNAILVNTCASLSRFNEPLLRCLASKFIVAEWQFCQTPDETSDVDVPVHFLREYLNQFDQPVHLLGHGISGVVALLATRRYPEKIRSLTLLGVGAQSGRDWISHYYTELQTFHRSRRQLLARIVQDLFGPQNQAQTRRLMCALQSALFAAPCQHSLLQTVSHPLKGVPVPFMVCGSLNDVIAPPRSIYQWLPLQKHCDRIWHCAQGRHFFHHVYPKQVSEQILDFWQTSPTYVGSPIADISFSNLNI